MVLEMLNRMGLRWTWFLAKFVFFCDVSSLFNVANMRQVVSKHVFLQYMRTPMMRRVSGELKS